MAGPFAPTDWQASDITVVNSIRPAGPQFGRTVIAKIVLHTNGVSGAALTYPSGGIPYPPAAYFGMREYINFMIPLGPFAHVSHLSSVIQAQSIPAPTAVPTEPGRLRLFQLAATAQAGAAPTTQEFTTGGVSLITPTTNTTGYQMYVMAVGK